MLAGEGARCWHKRGLNVGRKGGSMLAGGGLMLAGEGARCWQEGA